MFLILVVNVGKNKFVQQLLPSLMSPAAASCSLRDKSASLSVLKGVATSDHSDICDYTDGALFSSWDSAWLDKWIFTKKILLLYNNQPQCKTDNLTKYCDYRYDPKTDTWTTVSSLSVPRDAVGVSLLGDRLYAVGGYDGQSYLNTVESYDAQNNEWTEVITSTKTDLSRLHSTVYIL